MLLTKDEVRGIADYARIALTASELDQMTAYLNEAVELLEPIRAYDLEGIEPTFYPVADARNVTAEDKPDAYGRSLGLEEALHNAARTQGRAFLVPSILGEASDQRDPTPVASRKNGRS